MISIVIPAYNEDKNLEILIPRIKFVMELTDFEYEAIIVDDGSIDDTFNVLKKLKDKHSFLKTINLKENSGQSKAIWEGFKTAKGETVITMDADLQNDPQNIVKILESFEGIEMVCGCRKKRQDNWIKKTSSKIANFIRKKSLSSPIIDSACGFKAIKKECLQKIEFFDGIHRFLPDLFLRQGFKVKQIEIDHKPRMHGKSNYNIRNRAFKAFFDLIKVKFKFYDKK